MISYEQTPHGRLLANTFLISDTPNDAYITLMTKKGNAMRYSQDVDTHIDFPGEYDIAENTIVCFEANEMLHYQLIIEGESIVVIQNPALLEKETLGDVDTRICLDAHCKDAIERDELEGAIVVLN